jgi:hypothetical protein
MRTYFSRTVVSNFGECIQLKMVVIEATLPILDYCLKNSKNNYAFHDGCGVYE